jgi:hypothetical protein
MPELAPCGDPRCPIVPPHDIDRRSLRIVSMPERTELWRVADRRYESAAFTPPGRGNGRFSPLQDRSHTYGAGQRSAALLESALHEASGPDPKIYLATLEKLQLHRLRFTKPLRLIDLRDDALPSLDLERSRLTGSTPRHYRCTRAVAEHLVGAKGSHGLLWTSRQGSLHAERNPDGLASEVLRHESLDVAVVYTPNFPGRVRSIESRLLVEGGQPTRFIVELANLLRIPLL